MMHGKHIAMLALTLLCVAGLGGCAGSFGGFGGGAPAAAGPEARAGELAAAIGKTALGAAATAADPGDGAPVAFRVEGEYLAGTGEVCRNASLAGQAGGAPRAVTACKGRDGWVLVPEILSSPLGGRR